MKYYEDVFNRECWNLFALLSHMFLPAEFEVERLNGSFVNFFVLVLIFHCADY